MNKKTQNVVKNTEAIERQIAVCQQHRGQHEENTEGNVRKCRYGIRMHKALCQNCMQR